MGDRPTGFHVSSFKPFCGLLCRFCDGKCAAILAPALHPPVLAEAAAAAVLAGAALSPVLADAAAATLLALAALPPVRTSKAWGIGWRRERRDSANPAPRELNPVKKQNERRTLKGAKSASRTDSGFSLSTFGCPS